MVVGWLVVCLVVWLVGWLVDFRQGLIISKASFKLFHIAEYDLKLWGYHLLLSSAQIIDICYHVQLRWLWEWKPGLCLNWHLSNRATSPVPVGFGTVLLCMPS